MKTTVKKSFLDIQNEEKWLNEQGENSLMLVGYHNGVYEFENVFPVKYQYKIDLPTYTGSRKKKYLDFLEQSGIYFVAEYGGRVYLKKNAADGPLDMYTGKEEINKQVNRRRLPVSAGALSLDSDIAFCAAKRRSVLDYGCHRRRFIGFRIRLFCHGNPEA